MSDPVDDPADAVPTSGCHVTSGGLFVRPELTLYFEILGTGSGTPLVVLNGGPGVDHTYMHCSAVWERLAEHRPVLLYDPRGTGRSSRLTPGQSCSYRDQLEDLHALLDHVGWATPDLLGHSFGGNIAMGYVARHPDRVRRLMLVDSGPPKDLDEAMLFEKLYPDVCDRWVSFNFAETLGDDEAFRASFMTYYTMLFYSPERRDAFMATASADGVIRAVNEALWTDVKRYDLWPELAKFKLPTLVITGRFDANIAPAAAFKIHKAIPGSQFAVFERSGHKPFYEEPEAFQALIEAFIS